VLEVAISPKIRKGLKHCCKEMKYSSPDKYLMAKPVLRTLGDYQLFLRCNITWVHAIWTNVLIIILSFVATDCSCF